MDALSQYYFKIYGNTIEINTPERQKLREKVLQEFLSIGSARKISSSEKKSQYVFDGPLKKNYEMILVCGLPAVGKSTTYTNPKSAEIGAAIETFLTGEMKGTNIILPIVATNLDELLTKYIKPFEAAGYNVRAVYIDAPENVSFARNIARQLDSGRMFRSAVAASFGEKPKEVYMQLKKMKNSNGKSYGMAEYEYQEH